MGFSSWEIWQYSKTRDVPGIKGLVDLDILSINLTWKSLQQKMNRPYKIYIRKYE